MSRLRRQHLLREILVRRPASTQDELVADLRSEGMVVTQATVSRDLAAIGAVRGPEGYMVPGPAGSGFAAAQHQEEGRARLASVVRSHVMDAVGADALVVLRTAPGHANFVASELDAVRLEGVVGCIAGDDTIFLATHSANDAGALARSLVKMMSGSPGDPGGTEP